MIKWLDRLVAYIENVLLAVSILCLSTIAAIVMIVVLERIGIGRPIPDDVIIMQQLMVTAVGCSLAYVTRENRHISVDLLYGFFGPALRRISDLTAILVGLVATAPIVIWAGRNFLRSVEIASYYSGINNLPEWPARFFFFLAFLMVALRLLIMLVAQFRSPLDTVSNTSEK